MHSIDFKPTNFQRLALFQRVEFLYLHCRSYTPSFRTSKEVQKNMECITTEPHLSVTSDGFLSISQNSEFQWTVSISIVNWVQELDNEKKRFVLFSTSRDVAIYGLTSLKIWSNCLSIISGKSTWWSLDRVPRSILRAPIIVRSSHCDNGPTSKRSWPTSVFRWNQSLFFYIVLKRRIRRNLDNERPVPCKNRQTTRVLHTDISVSIGTLWVQPYSSQLCGWRTTKAECDLPDEATLKRIVRPEAAIRRFRPLLCRSDKEHGRKVKGGTQWKGSFLNSMKKENP